MKAEEINDLRNRPNMSNRGKQEKIIPLHGEFTEEEVETILTLIRRESKRCKIIAETPIKGYGTANEYAKKESWRNKAQSMDELESKFANCLI
jgi:hypothetical protein